MISARLIAAIVITGLCRPPAGADTFVKITQPEGQDGSGTGCSSGTLVGWTTDCSRGIFISCAHGYDKDRPVEVEVEPGRTAEGRILAIDRDLELSLIAAPISRATEMLRLADRAPPALPHGSSMKRKRACVVRRATTSCW